MKPQLSRARASRPLTDALSDTWLQVRAKPIIYLLIWLTLALAPYLLMGLLLGEPITSSMGDLFALMDEANINAIAETGEFPDGYVPIMLRLTGYYLLVLGVNSLTAIYMGAVMAGTVGRFRDRTFPRFFDALSDGAAIFPRFLLVVLYAAGRILLRAAAIGIGGGLLAVLLQRPALASFTFFAGFFFFLTDLYRYGLAPFIHLSLKSRGRDSCAISRAFYVTNRPVVASLFLALVVFPVVFITLIYTVFLSSGLFFAGGSLAIWLVQSILQFAVAMALINFARNTFTPALKNRQNEWKTETGDIEGTASTGEGD